MMMIIIINYFINFFGCSLDFWTWLYAWLPMTLGHILYRYEKNNVFFFFALFSENISNLLAGLVVIFIFH